ncbi:hypothetical protein ACIA5D_36750 [Actinoplanes sp. NPDC051513]|uniref:hypothetical protein n=1 Tax=Actinoplanes sp. NPDC051513 TaxID=3363908 RepID=UPI0037B144FB
MTVVELTPAQQTRARELGNLLAAADNCDLWLEPGGSSVLTDREYFGVSDPIDNVTEEVAIAEKAGFLVSKPYSTGGPGGSWRLTPAGAAALAFYRAALRSRQ